MTDATLPTPPPNLAAAASAMARNEAWANATIRPRQEHFRRVYRERADAAIAMKEGREQSHG